MKNFNWEDLANWALDALLETWGYTDTLESLAFAGFTLDEIVYLGFDREEAEEAVATAKAQHNWLK